MKVHELNVHIYPVGYVQIPMIFFPRVSFLSLLVTPNRISHYHNLCGNHEVNGNGKWVEIEVDVNIRQVLVKGDGLRDRKSKKEVLGPS